MNFKNILMFTSLFVAGFVGTFVYARDSAKYFDDEKANVQKKFERRMDQQEKLKIEQQDVKNVKELVAISRQLNKLAMVYAAMSQACKKDCFNREYQDQYISQDLVEACAYSWLMGAKSEAVADARVAVREAIMNIRKDFSDEQESEIAGDIAAEREDYQSFEDEETSVDFDIEAKDSNLAEAIVAEQK